MLHLRRATESDIDTLYHWANNPEVRKNSFNTDHIPYDTHKKWFSNMMKDENVVQYILEDEGVAIGQIRININENIAEIGYSISSEFRSQGYGRKMLKLVVSEIKENYPEVIQLIAKVKPENIASNKLFESEGYEMVYSCYKLELNRN